MICNSLGIRSFSFSPIDLDMKPETRVHCMGEQKCSAETCPFLLSTRNSIWTTLQLNMNFPFETLTFIHPSYGTIPLFIVVIMKNCKLVYLEGKGVCLCLMKWMQPITVAARSLGHEPFLPAWTLRSWVRIPLEAWISVCVYAVFDLFCV
jgi:hypothetical protein